jgi:hypothetical protein
MSPEEFFMYLIIGLIVIVPVAARLYRYVTAARVKQMLREMPAQDGSRSEKDARPKP